MVLDYLRAKLNLDNLESRFHILVETLLNKDLSKPSIEMLKQIRKLSLATPAHCDIAQTFLGYVLMSNHELDEQTKKEIQEIRFALMMKELLMYEELMLKTMSP